MFRECHPPLVRCCDISPGPSCLKCFYYLDIFGVFEFLQMRAEVAVACDILTIGIISASTIPRYANRPNQNHQILESILVFTALFDDRIKVQARPVAIEMSHIVL